MRVWRYSSAATEGRAHVAISTPDRLPVDLAQALRAAWGASHSADSLAHSTSALIDAGPAAWAAADAAIAGAPEEATVDLDAPGLRWLCPLDHLASLRDFLAFKDHVRRGAVRRGAPIPPYWFEAPVYYKGNHRQVIGPGEVCPWPRYTQHLDFELELAMVVGCRGESIGRDDAASYIFGFTILDDFSARDVQAKESAAWLGPAKAKDFCTALGPCIVTADELGPQPDLAMVCRVNGEEWGRARSSLARWSWSDMIAHVSDGEEIYPCDVYGSGTPGGCCGLDLDRRLEPGDVVELEVERIGILRNTIGFPAP